MIYHVKFLCEIIFNKIKYRDMCINNAALPTFTRSKFFPPLPSTDTPLMTVPNVLKTFGNTLFPMYFKREIFRNFTL